MCIFCASTAGANSSLASAASLGRARRHVNEAVAKKRKVPIRRAQRRRRAGDTSILGRSRPILIEPSWVLLCNENDEFTLVKDHTVVVENDVITEVVPKRRSGRDRRVRAPGAILLPGFISGHTHVAGGTVTRGIIEGGRNYGRPLELADSLDDAGLEAITAHNLAELLRSGCTTQVEMSMSLRQVQSYVRVASQWGVRGYPSAMVPGIGRLFDIWRRSDDQVLFDSVPASLAEIEQALDFGRQVNGSENGRIQSQMGVHATDTQTPETMQAFATAARKLGNGIHMHLSQGPAETETVRRLWGKRPAEWIDDFGFYEGALFAAHLSGADLDLDPEILRVNNATYAHSPSAGGAGGGTQPWPEMLAAGVNTNIGIDTHSNDHLENVKLAVLYGQARYDLLAESGHPLARPTIWDAIRAVTINPANGLGRSDLGRIRPGAKADLITVDVTGLLVGSGAVPPEPLNNLLYAHGRCVRDVMIDGHFMVRKGSLVVDDEHRVIRDGGDAVTTIWEQLRVEGWFDQ